MWTYTKTWDISTSGIDTKQKAHINKVNKVHSISKTIKDDIHSISFIRTFDSRPSLSTLFSNVLNSM